MRKIFFILFYLFFISSFSFAQKDSTKAHRKGFSIEPVIGLGTSEAVQNGTNNLGGRIGCGLVYMFNDHWGIASGLQVQRYSTTVITGKDSEYQNGNIQGAPGCWADFTINTTYTFSYCELPIMVRYLSGTKDKIGIFTEVGLIIGMLIKSSESGTVFQTNIDTTKGSPFIVNGYPLGYEITGTHSFNKGNANTKQFNFQGDLTLGLFFNLSRRCSIFADISINKGFTNIGNTFNDFLNPPTVPSITPIYYYNNGSSNLSNSSVTNYGTNFSAMLSVRLNIKLGK